MVRIDEPDTLAKEPQEIRQNADHTIVKISDLLEIFPPLQA